MADVDQAIGKAKARAQVAEREEKSSAKHAAEAKAESRRARLAYKKAKKAFKKANKLARKARKAAEEARQRALGLKKEIETLLANNRAWAERMCEEDPDFFSRLSRQQNPDYLWIGCSDSRVPANQIVSLPPGEVFVHRNVANLLHHNDMNALSVVQYAVDVLQVRHIMVVGHYGCGGVQAASRQTHVGPCCDKWLEHVHEVIKRHDKVLREEPAEHRRAALLCELNVLEQSYNVCKAPAVQAAWKNGQALFVHGWIYRLGDGRLRHMDFSVDGAADLDALREKALRTILHNRNEYYRRQGG